MMDAKPAAPDTLPYRRCVGIMLINPTGLVWIGRRVHKLHDNGATHFWQMPQGGIDEGEDPADAARRELYEETGVRSARIIAESRDWLTYDLPGHLVGVALRGRYRGQRQKWYAMELTGPESEIMLDAHPGEKQEFDEWRWAHLAELPALIVPFKRPVYEQLVVEFAPLTAPRS